MSPAHHHPASPAEARCANCDGPVRDAFRDVAALCQACALEGFLFDRDARRDAR